MEKKRAKTRSSGLKNASKSIYIELFFDLVFVFCMNNIIPVIANSSEQVVGWYTFYTFSFTSLLLLQIWFDVTIFMNRFGTGSLLDVGFLIVNALLLIVMSQVISTGWEHFRIYNACWILILINCILHWFIRYRMFFKDDQRYKKLVFRTMGIMGAQALLVLIGTFSGSFWGQVIALVAVIVGFFSWSGRDAHLMNSRHYHHLVERCALLMIMMFGETLVAAASYSGVRDHTVSGCLNLLIIVAMFLIYIVEHNRALDYKKLRNGLGLMALTTWQTYVLALCAVSFDLMIQSRSLWFLDGSQFFSLCIAVFLLSFFFYMPFNRPGEIANKRMITLRVALCVACCVMSYATVSALMHRFVSSELYELIPDLLNNVVFSATTGLCFLLVSAVLVLDWTNYRRPTSTLFVDPQAPASEAAEEEAALKELLNTYPDMPCRIAALANKMEGHEELEQTSQG